MDQILAKLTQVLEKLYYSIAAGGVLVLLLLLGYHHEFLTTIGYWGPFFTVLHVLSGITWIGLLYYFNLVQTPTMPKIPADLKPGVSKYIAPEALFWFRWSALSTVITGLIVYMTGTAMENLTIKTGMALGLIMAFNVWFVIWPNQKKVLGIVKVEDSAKTKAARIAMLTSRVNFVLSLPMLYCMVMARLVG
jgi:uncharacterized membrane protein